MKDPSQVKETLEKPQVKFGFDIDNTDLPFVPKLKSKPHGKTPLDLNILKAQENRESYFEGISNVIISLFF